MFGFYADSLADAAFWTWFGARRDPNRLIQLAAVAAWAAPVATVGVASIAKGKMVESPRPALLRPAAAMQGVLALRALVSRAPIAAMATSTGSIAPFASTPAAGRWIARRIQHFGATIALPAKRG
jgi:hypothetical protein